MCVCVCVYVRERGKYTKMLIFLLEQGTVANNNIHNSRKLGHTKHSLSLSFYSCTYIIYVNFLW